MKKIFKTSTIADQLSRCAERHPLFSKFTGLMGESLNKNTGKLEGRRNSLLTLIGYPSIPQYIHTSCKAFTFTMAERRSSASEQRVECRRHATRFLRVEQDSRFHILGYSPAFTMAEILISLTIIGVIAAITLPSLQANINESAWRTQRKAFYSRLSQAISMLPSMNGYGEYQGTWSNDSVTVTKDTAAQAFVTDGLSKVLKISNICDNNNFDKCGIPSKYTTLTTGSKINFPKNLGEFQPYFNHSQAGLADYINPQKHINTNAAAFETVNGEHVAVFYNPSCVSRDVKYPMSGTADALWKDAESIFPYLCASFMFDMNGKKGPNKMGKDIWVITSIYSVEPSVVMLDPDKITKVSDNMTFDDAKQWCASKNARMANVDEGIAGRLSSIGFGWLSGDTGEVDRAYVTTTNGTLIKYPKDGSGAAVRCIKR